MGLHRLLSPTKPSPLSPASPCYSSPTEVVVELPSYQEAMVLKARISKAHPAKSYAFSLAHMRKVTVPPVEIPVAYRTPRAKSMQVGGRQVPYTRDMWRRRKRRIVYRRLDTIHENVVYD